MKLQFLIPQYRETEEMIWPLLTSIALQRRLDFSEIGAIICNDGSDKILSDRFLSQFPFKIEYIKAPHRGVSAARNTCLAAATADYVMFCDADDMFCTTHELWQALKSLYENPCDILICDYLEEWHDNNGYYYITVSKKNHTIHGKIFSRDFLIKKNIFWHEDLTNIEDNFFCYLAYSETESIGYYHYTTYVYSNVEGSITHSKNYNMLSVLDVIKTYSYLIQEFLKRENTGYARSTTVDLVCKIYLTLNADDWLKPENSEIRKKVEKKFKEFFLTYKALFDISDNKEKIQYMEGQRKFVTELWGPFIESISLNDWLRHIMEED